MSKKIQRNSKCPCGSELKYKKCCGLGAPVTANTLSFITSKREKETEFDKVVKQYTGHYPDDYIKPITVKVPIFHILIDESKLDNHYAVSGIVISKDELDINKSVKTDLNILAEDFNIDNFHFTEIFGRRRIIRGRENEFISRYSKLVNQLKMYPFSICMTKEEVKEYQSLANMTNEQIYMSLQWQLMFKIFKFMIWKFGVNFIVHMWREQENITIEKRLLHQENIAGLLESFPFANISIYRHYEIFMKQELLSSSLADLVAYSTTRIKSRIDDNMPDKKIIRDNYLIIKLLSKVFSKTNFIDIQNLDNYIDEVKKLEFYKGG